MNYNDILIVCFIAVLCAICVGMVVHFICWIIGLFTAKKPSVKKTEQRLSYKLPKHSPHCSDMLDSIKYCVGDCDCVRPIFYSEVPQLSKVEQKHYYAIIEDDRYKDGRPSFSVTFPDLDDLVTFGDTLKQALEAARDVLKTYLKHSPKEYVKKPSTASELVSRGYIGWMAEIKVDCE